MLRCLALALVALSLAGCGLTCEDACAKAVECGAFDSTESAECVTACGSTTDDVWLTCMDKDDCAEVDSCSL